jgi:hypothetical protein
MSTETENEFALRALLATAPRPPDELFALRIDRLVRAEQRLRLAKRAALRHLGIELIAVISLTIAFLLIRELAGRDLSDGGMQFSLQLTGLTLLALWLWASRSAEPALQPH